MCFKFIKSGHKRCSNGDSCKYKHPKIWHSSLLSHRCDRVKCYFYHATGMVGPTLIKIYSELMCKGQFLAQLPWCISDYPQCLPLATDTLASVPHKSPMPFTKPYNVAASSKTRVITSAFLDQMKEMNPQMIQMQQTQNFLLKNIVSQVWPPLPAHKVNPFPGQMF